MKKKREFLSSDLVKIFAKKHGFEEKLLAFQIKDYLREYLDEPLFKEIIQVDVNNKILEIRIKSPLLKNDFRMRKSFYLKKICDKFGDQIINDLLIL